MKKYELMTLPYAADALEPVISKETIGFHHGKHLLAYVNNLNLLMEQEQSKARLDSAERENGRTKFNGLLEESPLADLSLEEIVKKAEGGILNNAGQILNHELYFGQFAAPKADNKPTGKMADTIERDFGSFEAFKEEFQKKGATLFGSGWVWLSADKDGKLVITQETNAANPVQRGLKPLLTFDVWEHAYYLDYQNRRPDHLAALWQIVNWEVVERRYHQ
ncbi:MAG: superoxide dismutase [Prevotella sp.]|nr:superoxide dismutase [Prevotella sp.]